jgi:hypothetical protein
VIFREAGEILKPRHWTNQQSEILRDKLIDLLSTLSQQRVPSSLRNIGPQWPLLGLLGAMLIATEYTMVLGTFNLFFGQMIAGFVAFFLIPLARYDLRPNVSTMLKADSRRPVLLMRSFIDDERMSDQMGIQSLIDFKRFFGLFNWQSFIDDEITRMKSEKLSFDSPLESRLACHLRRYGPFLAVGAPSQGMPVIGAARIKLTDLEWRDQVVRWIDDSVIILMMAGMTERNEFLAPGFGPARKSRCAPAATAEPAQALSETASAPTGAPQKAFSRLILMVVQMRRSSLLVRQTFIRASLRLRSAGLLYGARD